MADGSAPRLPDTWLFAAAQKGATRPHLPAQACLGHGVPCPALQQREAQLRILPHGRESGLSALYGSQCTSQLAGLSTHTGHVVVTPMTTEAGLARLQCRSLQCHTMKLKLSEAESPARGQPRPWSGSSAPRDCMAHSAPEGPTPPFPLVRACFPMKTAKGQVLLLHHVCPPSDGHPLPLGGTQSGPPRAQPLEERPFRASEPTQHLGERS